VSFLQPLADKSLADGAYERIREAILQMALKPGEALVEAKLAATLGISKTPIRQALRHLEQSGLVVVVPNKGYFVSELTQRDAQEILELRAVLEGLATFRACARLTDEEIDHLEDLLTQAHEAHHRGEIERTAELGHEFHRILHQKADNQRLCQMLDMLSDQFHRIRLLSSHTPVRLPRSMDEHARLFEALRARDAVQAEALMRAHLFAVYAEVENDDTLAAPEKETVVRSLSMD
jgi:DNA-binding GntR family transcriptional regulator